MPTERMGLPPRSLAADAHSCIMVLDPSGSAEYKDVARDLRRHPEQGSPQIVLRLFVRCCRGERRRLVDPDAPERTAIVLGPVKGWPGKCCA
jgi:hypothetical protein